MSQQPKPDQICQHSNCGKRYDEHFNTIRGKHSWCSRDPGDAQVFLASTEGSDRSIPEPKNECLLCGQPYEDHGAMGTDFCPDKRNSTGFNHFQTFTPQPSAPVADGVPSAEPKSDKFFLNQRCAKCRKLLKDHCGPIGEYWCNPGSEDDNTFTPERCGHENCREVYNHHIPDGGKMFCFVNGDQTFASADSDTVASNSTAVPVGELKAPDESEEKRWPIMEAERELQRIFKEHPEYIDGTADHFGQQVKTSKYGGGWRGCYSWLDKTFDITGATQQVAALLREVEQLKLESKLRFDQVTGLLKELTKSSRLVIEERNKAKELQVEVDRLKAEIEVHRSIYENWDEALRIWNEVKDKIKKP